MLSGAKTTTDSGHSVSMTKGPPLAQKPPSPASTDVAWNSSVKQKVKSTHDRIAPARRQPRPVILFMATR